MDVMVGARHGPGRRWWRRSAATLLDAGAMLAAAVVPAGASDVATVGAQSCDELARAETTTPAQMREQTGAAGLGLNGGAVGIAVIDTGVDAVPALHGVRVINLSFDPDATESRTVGPLSRAAEDPWGAGIVAVVAGGSDGRALDRLGNPPATWSGASWS